MMDKLYQIPFRSIKLVQPLERLDSNPHRSEVYRILAEYNGCKKEFVIKLFRSPISENEIAFLTKDHIKSPRIIEYDKTMRYIVYEKANGICIKSQQIINNKNTICCYGKSLADIHMDNEKYMLSKQFADIQVRKDIVLKKCKTVGMDRVGRIIEDGITGGLHFGFTHGDYHPRNILFSPDGTEQVVIDWELCGDNYQEFELAYAAAPENVLFPTWEHTMLFLRCYGEKRDFNIAGFRYFYLLMCVMHYPIEGGEEETSCRNLILNRIEYALKLR